MTIEKILRGTERVALWPKWFTAGKQTPEIQKLHVSKGLHPLGRRLCSLSQWEAGAKCGNCRYNSGNRAKFKTAFRKCTKAKATRGKATDLRLKWRACEKWEEVRS